MVGASSRSAQNGPGVNREESEAAGLLLAYRPDYFVFGHDHAFPLQIRPLLEPETGRSVRAGPRSIDERAISNHIKLDPNQETILAQLCLCC